MTPLALQVHNSGLGGVHAIFAELRGQADATGWYRWWTTESSTASWWFITDNYVYLPWKLVYGGYPRSIWSFNHGNKLLTNTWWVLLPGSGGHNHGNCEEPKAIGFHHGDLWRCIQGTLVTSHWEQSIAACWWSCPRVMNHQKPWSTVLKRWWTIMNVLVSLSVAKCS